MKQVLRGKLKASGPQGSREKKHFTFTLSPHSALPLIKAIFLSYTPFCLTDCIMFKLDSSIDGHALRVSNVLLRSHG